MYRKDSRPELEGLAAGGGVRSRAVDPGVPLGPGLLATCVFHGPHARIAIASDQPLTLFVQVSWLE
jgi:hypothetical protein